MNGTGKEVAGKLNFGKIFKLFDDAHSADLYDRQVAVVTRVCKLSEGGGFWLGDLDSVSRLIDVMRARLQGGIDAFEAPLANVLQICGEPFARSKANEMMASEEAVMGLFSTLAALVSDGELRGGLRQAAADALLQITAGRSSTAANSGDEATAAAAEERRPQLATYNQRLLDRSGALRTVVSLFAETAASARDEVEQPGGIGGGGGGAGGVRFGAGTAAAIEEASSDDDDDEGGEGEGAAAAAAAASAAAPGAAMAATLAAAAKSPLRRLLASLLMLTRELSGAPQNAAALTACGATAAVVDTLAATADFRDPLVSGGVEILWNLLEHADRVLGPAAAALGASGSSNASRALASSLTAAGGGCNPLLALQTADAHAVLCDLLRALLVGGFKQQDKELRNELLIAATLLASQPQSWPLFRQSGLLDLAVLYASDPNGDAGGPADEREGDVHNYGTTGEEDFELKQLLWGLVYALCERDVQSLEAVAEQSRFLPTLLASVDEPPALVQAWGATQLKALQLQALGVLAGLATQVPQRFSDLGGMGLAVSFVQTACSLDILDNPAPDMELRAAALKLILHTSALLDFPDQLGELGAVEAMLGLFSDSDGGGGGGGGGGTPIEMRRDALSVISCLCRGGHEANQTVFRKAGGIEALRACLRYDTSEAVNNNFLTVAAVDAAWATVVGNRRSEARLLHLEGVEALLDLLEACPALMRNQVLGVMADLCRNARAPPRFRCWKSSTPSMATAAQLLLGLWVAEEGRLNVPRVKNGLLNSLDTPLGPLPGQEADGGGGGGGGGDDAATAASTTGPSPAFARLKEALAAAKDMSRSERALQEAVSAQDMRCKIFAVLQSVGFEQVADDLAREERMTFATAQNYPEFRRGQEWLGVKRELRDDGCNPISADALLIESKLEQSFDLASATKCRQQMLLQAATQAGESAEKDFFTGILLQREQELQAQKLMQKAGGGSTKPSAAAKKRLDAQKKKAAMVKNSSMMSQTS